MYIHHSKLDLIDNIDHMLISGTEPSLVIQSHPKFNQNIIFLKWLKIGELCESSFSYDFFAWCSVF